MIGTYVIDSFGSDFVKDKDFSCKREGDMIVLLFCIIFFGEGVVDKVLSIESDDDQDTKRVLESCCSTGDIGDSIVCKGVRGIVNNTIAHSANPGNP